MLWFIIVAVSIAADRLVKWWSVVSLKSVGDIPLIKGVFHLTYAENTGAAFSMFSGTRWILVGVTGIGVCYVLYLLWKKPYPSKLFLWGLSLIAGGGIGNLIDRIRYGYVYDMFYIKLINFAIFNIADLCVTAGAVLVILFLLKMMREEKLVGKAH